MGPETDPPTQPPTAGQQPYGPGRPHGSDQRYGGPPPAQQYGATQGYPAGPPPATTDSPGLVATVLVGAAVSVGLGVFGGLHTPTDFAVNIAGFSSGAYAKAWLATLAAALGIIQVISSMIMYGKLMAAAPPWIGTLHRWSGRLAVLATVPVAMHCLYALGAQFNNPRQVIHSLFGCLFYGAFVSKMLTLTRPNLPARTLPVLGGVVFTGLVALWLTSALWLFDTKGLKF